jgi:hypothetical protein
MTFSDVNSSEEKQMKSSAMEKEIYSSAEEMEMNSYAEEKQIDLVTFSAELSAKEDPVLIESRHDDGRRGAGSASMLSRLASSRWLA